jgi:hypothetical protein
MTSFQLPACITRRRGGGDLARYSGHGRSEVATGRVARIWEEYDSVLGMTSTPERPSSSSSTAAVQGPARARGENSKPGCKMRPQVNGGLMTGAYWAPRRFTVIADLLHCTLDPSLGACVRLGEEHVRGGSTLGCQWAAKSERGPRDRSVAVHWDRRLHRTLLVATSILGPHGRHRGHQHSRIILFGMAVLNCTQEFKNRPFWTTPSGLKWVACHMLAALSALQQLPYVLLW